MKEWGHQAPPRSSELSRPMAEPTEAGWKLELAVSWKSWILPSSSPRGCWQVSQAAAGQLRARQMKMMMLLLLLFFSSLLRLIVLSILLDSRLNTEGERGQLALLHPRISPSPFSTPPPLERPHPLLTLPHYHLGCHPGNG